MTDKPYTYENDGGDRLKVCSSADGWTAYVEAYGDGAPAAAVNHDAAIDVARALCEHAGRDVIILDRPDGDAVVNPMWNLVVHQMYGITVEAPQPLAPDEARCLAAHIAAEADRAESEPDPDEVTELARLINATQTGMDQLSSPTLDAARAVLRRYRLETR